MTDTTTAHTATPLAAAARTPAPPRLRRRPALAGLGLALVCLGGLAAAWIVTGMDSSTSVVVAARDVSRGQVIASEDLAEARVSGLGPSAAISGEALAATVGQTAATDLPAGMPVPPASVTTDPLPGPGQSIVGIKLAAGQMPTVDLLPGDQVRVVSTPRTQDDPPASTPAGIEAVVASTSVDEISGDTVVNVVLPEGQAPQVAALAATARAALILDNAGG